MSSPEPMSEPRAAARARGETRLGEVLLRVVIAAALAYDAYSHLDLATSYDLNAASLSQGTLFRIEAMLAIVAAVLVLATRWRIAALGAFLIAAGGLAALLLYRYVDIGAIGPLPNMYEPAWFPEKTWSAISMAVASIAALIVLVLRSRRA
jgi:hypothetical protein